MDRGEIVKLGFGVLAIISVAGGTSCDSSQKITSHLRLS